MRVKLFVPDLGMVVDVETKDAERLAQGVDVIAHEGQVAAGVFFVLAADAVRCWVVDHGVGSPGFR